MLNYDDYTEGTRLILEESRKERYPYKVEVGGREFIVLPDVFSPKYFNDTECFALNIPINQGEEVLEIGPGTGVISIFMIYKGAKRVLAIDINPEAVENTKQNVILHGMEGRVEVRQGNLFTAVKEGETFDTIFWNTPFAYTSEENISDLEKSVYDPKYVSTEKFIKEAYMYLKKNGRLLIGFSSVQGKLDLLEKFLVDAGYDMKMVYQADSIETHPVKFEIFEARLKN